MKTLILICGLIVGSWGLADQKAKKIPAYKPNPKLEEKFVCQGTFEVKPFGKKEALKKDEQGAFQFTRKQAGTLELRLSGQKDLIAKIYLWEKIHWVNKLPKKRQKDIRWQADERTWFRLEYQVLKDESESLKCRWE
jgi:hypothetical protein